MLRDLNFGIVRDEGFNIFGTTIDRGRRITLAAFVAAGLLCYLIYALLRPERF
jgi:K+-transporting ATPase KdpF subunit